MKTYRVRIPVTAEIEVTVKAVDEDDAHTKAVRKAIEEHPRVEWLVDEYTDKTIEEVNGEEN